MKISSLNEAQIAAVQDTEGPVVVFAGAGSGKTRVLTHRIAYLIAEKNVSPRNILAITFTNKAAKEMKTRLQDMLGEDMANGVWVSTFHALCLSILRYFPEEIGFTSNFTVYDDSASARIVKKVLREKHLDEGAKDMYLGHMAKAKNKGLTPDEYAKEISTHPRKSEILEVFEDYQRTLFESNAMDFDDLLFNAYKLLVISEKARDWCLNRFIYIHVDEFQDTNVIQSKILKILASKFNNIFVVGDDDQSIYAWRGADITNILNFQKNFTGAKIYKLEQNYRSTQSILDAANRLIKHNEGRAEKTLFTENSNATKVEYWTSDNEFNEARRVSFAIKALKLGGVNRSDIAVLIRNNSLSRIFEKTFKADGIPYKFYGGFNFFDRKEIKDFVNYLWLLNNKKDIDALETIYNYPPRGIGPATWAKLMDYAINTKQIPYDVVIDIDNTTLEDGVKKKIGVLRDLILSLQAKKFSLPIVDFIKQILKEAGFESYYKHSDNDEDLNRWENLQEFLSYVTEEYSGGEQVDLSEFLQRMSLDSQRDTVTSDDDPVILSTMHSAKGLEFRCVIIAACEEGIIPSGNCGNYADGLEEERRVMYVAITRAKEKLIISSVNGTRMKYGQAVYCTPSRFVREMKGSDNSLQSKSGSMFLEQAREKYLNESRGGFSQSDITSYSIPHNTNVENKPKVYNDDVDRFKVGTRVNHKRYGEGVITSLFGNGNEAVAKINFEGLGEKKFFLANTPLEIKD